MALRDSTKEKYKIFLRGLLKEENVGQDVRKLLRESNIDMNLVQFLREKALISISNDIITKIYSEGEHSIDALVDDYRIFRDKKVEQGEEDRKDLEYYRANKEFLVDKRTLTVLTKEDIAQVENVTKERIIIEAAEYAEVAIRIGKKNIKEFIIALMTIQ